MVKDANNILQHYLDQGQGNLEAIDLDGSRVTSFEVS